ncbi:MAG: polysaccharide deacetylase family protein [Steroidobacteraceae bacterium]
MSRLTILNYHNVAVPPPTAQLPKLYVSPEQFEKQCWLLQRLGLRGVTLSEGLRALQVGGAQRCVALTFDDGYFDNLSEAAPIMKQFGFRATCYVVSGRVGEHNVWDADKLQVEKPLMNQTQLQEWLAAGHEVGSHTITHPRLDQLSRAQAEMEIHTSKLDLEAMLGVEIKHFCYPYGNFNDETVELVRTAGYQSAVSTLRGLASERHHLLRLPRVSINGDKGLLRFALKVATPYAAFGQRQVA